MELFRLAGGIPGLPDAGELLCGPALGLDLAGRLSVGDALIYEAAPVDPGAVGSANSAMRQMEDCHAVSVALRPPRCKGGHTYRFCAKTRAVAHSGPQ